MFIDRVAQEERATLADISSITNEMVRRLNEYSKRIKNIEQKADRLENRVGSIEEIVLTQMGDIKVSLERMSQKISLISERLTTIENEILRVNKDLSKAALKSDVKKIETFIDIVNPITAKFVTRDELERIIEEKVRRKA